MYRVVGISPDSHANQSFTINGGIYAAIEKANELFAQGFANVQFSKLGKGN